MRILVTGAHGLLGRSLLRYAEGRGRHIASEMIACGRGVDPVPGGSRYHQIDLLDEPRVRELLERVEPEWIIHTAAMTDVDGCETDRDAARRANLETVEVLVAACEQVTGGDCGLIQLSTDYVFDGDAGPYGEEDSPRPISYYGELKLQSERVVLSSHIKGAVLRTLWLYGYRRQARPNLVTWPLAALGRGEQLRIANDQWGNPTFVDDVARALLAICEHNTTGVLHLGGSDLMSRYDLVLRLAELSRISSGSVEPVSTRDLSQKAPRPLRSGLRSDRLTQLGIAPSTLEQGLDQMKSEDEFREDFPSLVEL